VDEPYGIVANLGPARGQRTVGAIFRRWPAVELIPGFAMYSRRRVPPDTGARDPRPLGVALVASGLPASSDGKARRLATIDRCLALFVDPLLDVFFSLAAQGVTLQLHAQNILFELDAEGRALRRVWVRDMGGVNYAPEFRLAHGQADLMPAAIAAVPGATAGDLSLWFERDGVKRRLFDERFIFGHAYDTQLSAFWFQLLVGFYRAGLFSRRELRTLRHAIRERAGLAARHHGFDTDLLLPRFFRHDGWMHALVFGVERNSPFRPGSVT